MFKIFALLFSGLLGIGVLAVSQARVDRDPDPDLIRLAVRATVHALPTATPRQVIVTEYVEVTRVVEVTRIVEVVREETAEPPTATPEPTSPPVPANTPEPVSQNRGAEVQAAAMVEAVAEPVAEPVAERATEPAVEPIVEAAADVPIEAPAASAPASGGGCPAASDRQYAVIPIEGGPTDRPAHEHGDLNPHLRGSQASEGHLGLVDINGPTDPNAPQLDGLFLPPRLPHFVGVRRAFDWNWGCGGHGCRGDLLGAPEATVALLQANPGEALAAPRRGPEIYGGGFVALVLFATETSLTLGYTREDSVANGYAVHLEQICVDPNLLGAYRAAAGQGRGALPALRNGEALGTAMGAVQVAIRDRGQFKDPRSRKDWWAQY